MNGLVGEKVTVQVSKENPHGFVENEIPRVGGSGRGPDFAIAFEMNSRE